MPTPLFAAVFSFPNGFLCLDKPSWGRMGDHYNLLHKAKNWGKGGEAEMVVFLSPSLLFLGGKKKVAQGWL